MNLKTTLVLLILVLAGGGAFILGLTLPGWGDGGTEPAADRGTLAVLEQELTADQVQRIEVVRGSERIVFERGGDRQWTLPGGWPTRPREVERLVELVTGLQSRFRPIPLGEQAELKSYGLDAPPVAVEVKTRAREYRLEFGEEPAGDNRFSRATFVRLADRDGQGWRPRPEALRLGPGIVALLDRPADYYQQRQLFPSERVAKEGGLGTFPEKVAQLKADGLVVKGAKAGYTLDRQGDDWVLAAPVRDRPDPDKMKSILRAVADVWAERFVAAPKPDLKEYGLDQPEQTITVRPPGAAREATLLIGKEAGELKRQVTKPPPPGLPPGLGAMTETVVEKLRYAKLADNNQVFEIRADPLKEIFVELKDLRDARLARFRAEDAVRVEVTPVGGPAIVLVKHDNKWRLEKPLTVPAETSKVTELLDKLELLRAAGDDVLDQADAKEHGLDPAAARVAIDLEEEAKTDGKPDAKKDKKKRTVTFLLGKHDPEKKKLYARVDGWPRVNIVDAEVLTLVNRPALAYRGKSLFDFAVNDLAAIAVQRPGEQFTLQQKDGVWRLAAPVDGEADSARAGKLAGDLSRLAAVEHVAAAPQPEELVKEYGLDKDALTVTLTFKEEAKKPPLTLRLGKVRAGKDEFYAKLDSEPGVFVVAKEIRDELVRSSLEYRPLVLWQVQPAEVVELRVEKQGGEPFRLVKGDGGWKVTGPFDAAVNAPSVQLLLDNLAPLRAERFVAHAAKDPKEYGLDPPALKITLLTGPGKLDQKDDKDKPTERVLLVGGETKDGPPGRFAKLATGDAVFVLGLLAYSAIDHQAVDLLDRKLLAVDKKNIIKVESVTGSSRWVLERAGEAWLMASAEPPFVPDAVRLDGLLSVWTRLDADRYAAYGPKVDWAKYGLDKPAARMTITVEKDKDKTELHSVALGLPVNDPKGPRYARVDEGPGVAVLGGAAVAELHRLALDFVDHQLLKLNASAIAAIHRRMGGDELELVKRDDGWQIVKPVMLRADDPALDQLARDLASLRALRVAAYHAKDLRAFGLDDPAALVTIRYTEGDKPAEKLLKIGESADPPGTVTGDRFATVEGTPIVGVLPGALVRLLVGKPVVFRDRSLARFANADKVILERGPRTAVFASLDGTWKLIQPVMADAEQAGLDDLISAMARLRADELVADKPQPTPEELQPFGLDRPEAKWRFLAGDKEVLNLVVGGREKLKDAPGDRVYARIGDGDLVFLLNPKITQQVLGEYRRRALWTTVDAFQVERVDFGHAANPFTLVKAGADWQVAAKPDLKLNNQAVNDTVAALANLKTERTILDKDADLKLFGLDPPQLVIEFQGKTGGKHVLALGHAEGDSKRRYARVVAGSRDDVFVLSEADTAKLFRVLGDFLAKAGEKKD